jgi:hypothetical protein
MTVPEKSQKYLKEFLQFTKTTLNYTPVILGGWAVYAYTKNQ